MTDHPPEELDRELRALFEPPAASIDRVLREVWAGEPARKRRPQLALRVAALALSAVVLVAAIALWPRPGPPVAVFPDPAASEAPSAPAVTALFDDDVLVLPLPDEAVAILGPGARDDRPPDGYGIVLVSGDER